MSEIYSINCYYCTNINSVYNDVTDLSKNFLYSKWSDFVYISTEKKLLKLSIFV